MEKPLDPVTVKIGTGNDNIKTIDNFMPVEDWQKFYNYFKSIENRQDKYRYFNFPHELLSEDMKNLVNKYTIILRNKVTELYQVEFDNDRTASLFIHPDGSELHPHSDTIEEYKEEISDVERYNETDKKYKVPTYEDLKEKFPLKWSGHISVLVYINDDYQGGEIYFPDRNIEIKPKANMFISFPGNTHYLHGVKTVKNNARFSLSLWTKFKDFQ